MKNFRRAALVLTFVSLVRLGAGELHWLADLTAAKQQAARENKQILADFTGATWCEPCIALHGEVLAGKEFAALARDYVLVQFDYPRLSERTPEKIAANPALQRLMALKDDYAIAGFPTLVFLDARGRNLGGAFGYSGNGPAAYLARLKQGKAVGKVLPPLR